MQGETGDIFVFPNMKGTRGGGMRMSPLGCWKVSSRARITRGVAHAVPFSVWANTVLLPLLLVVDDDVDDVDVVGVEVEDVACGSTLQRMFNLRLWWSVQFDALVIYRRKVRNTGEKQLRNGYLSVIIP